ncbi:flavin reductase family protein [Streptomyces sp. I05A-00742]|uniref:flavin reductase family protein n=1 Tax=Streptomyces sp. I05A-00742 TaxID=2732853 RepID=UPI001487CF00|nr:flavin reductase family protein [Streptomyces sp. I05A-00742]
MDHAATFGTAGPGFRAAMRHVPTAVAVLTVRTGTGPAGMTAGSVTSVSMDPELLSVSLRRDSRLTDAIADSGGFVVNLLQEHQSAIARWFASSERFGVADEFLGIGWHPAPKGGHPILTDAACVFECRTEGQVPNGDHLLTIGWVTACQVSPSARPLLSYLGRYHRISGRPADEGSPAGPGTAHTGRPRP